MRFHAGHRTRCHSHSAHTLLTQRHAVHTNNHCCSYRQPAGNEEIGGFRHECASCLLQTSPTVSGGCLRVSHFTRSCLIVALWHGKVRLICCTIQGVKLLLCSRAEEGCSARCEGGVYHSPRPFRVAHGCSQVIFWQPYPGSD